MKIEYDKAKKMQVVDFTSLSEAVSVAKEHLKPGHASTRHMDDNTWDFGVGFNGAVELSRSGWAEGVTDILAAARKIETVLGESIGQGFTHDVCGFSIDMGEYMTGNPECWFETSPMGGRRVIRLTVSCSYSSFVEAQQIRNRGGAIVALIDLLQRDPNNVIELIAVSATDCVTRAYDDWSNQQINVPLGTSPIDINSAAYVLAHPSFLRRICFALKEYLTDWKVVSGYGHPRRPEDPLASMIMPQVDPSVAKEFSTPESAAAWVERTYNEIVNQAAPDRAA
jgi:hypothetical protein